MIKKVVMTALFTVCVARAMPIDVGFPTSRRGWYQIQVSSLQDLNNYVVAQGFAAPQAVQVFGPAPTLVPATQPQFIVKFQVNHRFLTALEFNRLAPNDKVIVW